MKYYVYTLIDPDSFNIFYVGKGSGMRAWSHGRFKDGNKNIHKDRYIKDLYSKKKEPIVKIVKYFNDEDSAYNYEEHLIESIGLDKLTNILLDARPPSKKGWTPSKETLEKRSRGLKGIPRTTEWCQNLSSAKIGKNNPMYGKANPCSEAKRLSIITTKNLPNYDLYKQAIEMMNNGESADNVSYKLGIGRGVCFKLKNRSHLFFTAFPELR